MFTRKSIEDLFKTSNILTVTFTKANGDERTMRCTQDLSLVPEKFHPKSDKKKEPSETTCVAYEISVGWRSFVYERVLKVGVEK